MRNGGLLQDTLAEKMAKNRRCSTAAGTALTVNAGKVSRGCRPRGRHYFRINLEGCVGRSSRGDEPRGRSPGEEAPSRQGRHGDRRGGHGAGIESGRRPQTDLEAGSSGA